MPGRSGNPSGQSKALAEVRALARRHTHAAVATLVEVMKQGVPDAARLAAAIALLDRGWGRPPQAATISLEGPQPIYIFPPGTDPTLPDDQLSALAHGSGTDAEGEIELDPRALGLGSARGPAESPRSEQGRRP